MSAFRLTCPECLSQLTLPIRRLFVRVGADPETCGECVCACLMCGATIAVPIDREVVDALTEAGVSVLRLDAPAEGHPEAPPPGPAITLDDVLDLHLLLEDDAWPSRLAASSPGEPTG